MMGNQVSAGHHGLPLRHRRDSDGPTMLPPHVPPGAVAVPPGRLRQISGDPRLPDTPGTFETPPCINVKPSLAASSSASPSPPPAHHTRNPVQPGRPRAVWIEILNSHFYLSKNNSGRIFQFSTICFPKVVF